MSDPSFKFDLRGPGDTGAARPTITPRSTIEVARELREDFERLERQVASEPDVRVHHRLRTLGDRAATSAPDTELAIRTPRTRLSSSDPLDLREQPDGRDADVWTLVRSAHDQIASLRAQLEILEQPKRRTSLVTVVSVAMIGALLSAGLVVWMTHSPSTQVATIDHERPPVPPTSGLPDRQSSDDALIAPPVDTGATEPAMAPTASAQPVGGSGPRRLLEASAGSTLGEAVSPPRGTTGRPDAPTPSTSSTSSGSTKSGSTKPPGPATPETLSAGIGELPPQRVPALPPVSDAVDRTAIAVAEPRVAGHVEASDRTSTDLGSARTGPAGSSDASTAPGPVAEGDPSGAAAGRPSEGLTSVGASANTPSVTRGPIVLSRRMPVVPEAARRIGARGNVDLDVLIDVNGRVASATAVSGPALLRPTAEHAVRQWRFQPALAQGVPVASRRRMRITFE